MFNKKKSNLYLSAVSIAAHCSTYNEREGSGKIDGITCPVSHYLSFIIMLPAIFSLLWIWPIGPSQGLCLHRTTQQRQMRTNIHALSGIRTRDPEYECSRPARPPDRRYQPFANINFGKHDTCTRDSRTETGHAQVQCLNQQCQIQSVITDQQAAAQWWKYNKL
jgi:hypothetical protein